jgi:hypothetical protein
MMKKKREEKKSAWWKIKSKLESIFHPRLNSFPQATNRSKIRAAKSIMNGGELKNEAVTKR